MKYRPEIDGLRALAVLAVLFFHLGVRGFAGGFVGVDVFFVISGFLISSILMNDLEVGQFSRKRFYERRARRILPALIPVLLVSLALAWRFLAPWDLVRFSKSLVALTLFNSNHLFAMQPGYFDAAGWRDPLLHTWSLAAEEQFYLVYPLALAWMWKRHRPGTKKMLVAILLCSLACADGLSRYSPVASFFLLPTRLWELMAGAWLALDERERPPAGAARWQGGGAFAGLAAVLFAVFFFGPATRHPGLPTLLPVLGTVLIIRYAGAAGPVRSLLASRPMVGLGLISYSLYLWQQPLITFFRLAKGPPDSAQKAGLLGLSLILAWASWKWVEAPCRDSRRTSLAALRAALLASAALFAVLGLAGFAKAGFPGRFAPEVRKLYADYDGYDMRGIFGKELQLQMPVQAHADLPLTCCEPGGKPPAVTLWGDSFAESAFAGIARAFGKDQVALLTAGACPPAPGQAQARNPYCIEFNERVLRRLESEAPHLVLLLGNWSGEGLDSAGFRGGLAAGIVRLKAHGHRVVVLGTLPCWAQAPRELVPLRMMRGQAMRAYLPLGRREELDAIDAKIRQAVLAVGAEFIPLLPMTCLGPDCLALQRIGGEVKLMAFDSAHLSLEGSLYYGPLIRQAVDAGQARHGRI